jgi:hypothetical protein
LLCSARRYEETSLFFLKTWPSFWSTGLWKHSPKRRWSKNCWDRWVLKSLEQPGMHHIGTMGMSQQATEYVGLMTLMSQNRPAPWLSDQPQESDAHG